MGALPPPELRPLRHNFWENSRGSTEGLQPELLSILETVQKIYRHETANDHYKITITAGQEWHNGHGLFSMHHTGFAVDIRTSDLPGGGNGAIAKAIELSLIRALGKEYYVLRHKPPEAPHIHIQYRRGTRVSNPGDFHVGSKTSSIG